MTMDDRTRAYAEAARGFMPADEGSERLQEEAEAAAEIEKAQQTQKA